LIYARKDKDKRHVGVRDTEAYYLSCGKGVKAHSTAGIEGSASLRVGVFHRPREQITDGIGMISVNYSVPRKRASEPFHSFTAFRLFFILSH
jgi:hypothetical protein